MKKIAHDEKDSKIAVCPYWVRFRENKMNCELATFRFPDAESKREFSAVCCDMQGYKECPLFKTLTAYYERKYEEGSRQ